MFNGRSGAEIECITGFFSGVSSKAAGNNISMIEIKEQENLNSTRNTIEELDLINSSNSLFPAPYKHVELINSSKDEMAYIMSLSKVFPNNGLNHANVLPYIIKILYNVLFH
ncbi:MAG: hypothetical protein ACTSRH_16250 [Promethearchaeota archaeon]